MYFFPDQFGNLEFKGTGNFVKYAACANVSRL